MVWDGEGEGSAAQVNLADTPAIKMEPPAIDLSGEPVSLAKGGQALKDDAAAGEAPAPAAAEESVDDDSETPSAGHSNKSVPLKALEAERSKRQETQTQLAAMKQQLDDLVAEMQRGKSQPATQDEPDPYDDSIYDDLPGALRKVESRAEKKLVDYKSRVSEALAKEQFADYNEVMSKHYVAAIEANPRLYDQVMSHDLPAIAAYKAVKKYLENKDFNPEAATKLKGEYAELQSKYVRLQEQVEALMQQPESPAMKIPRGLREAISTGGNRATPWRPAKDTEIWDRK